MEQFQIFQGKQVFSTFLNYIPKGRLCQEKTITKLVSGTNSGRIEKLAPKLVPDTLKKYAKTEKITLTTEN